MAELFDKIAQIFVNFKWFNLIEIFAYFILICFSFIVLKSNKSKSVIIYFCVFGLISAIVLIAIKMNKPEFNGAYYFIGLLLLFVVSIVVLFATEIKRAIWN